MIIFRECKTRVKLETSYECSSDKTRWTSRIWIDYIVNKINNRYENKGAGYILEKAPRVNKGEQVRRVLIEVLDWFTKK